MTERLDRIEALLVSTAERLNETNVTLTKTNATLDRVATKQERNTDEIDILLGAVSSNEVAARENRAAIQAERATIEASQQADRDEYRSRFEAQGQRIQNLLDDARADRQAFNQRFEAERAESNQQFDTERAESNRRFDAMQEVLQRLLLEVRSTNGAVSGLSSRIDEIA